MKNSHTMNNFLHHKIFLDGFHLDPPFSPHWEKLADGFSTGFANLLAVTYYLQLLSSQSSFVTTE